MSSQLDTRQAQTGDYSSPGYQKSNDYPSTQKGGNTGNQQGTTGEGITAGAEHFAKEKYKEAREVFSEYIPQSTKENMRLAVRDTRSYTTRHPYVIPLLLLLSAMTGFALGSMTSSHLFSSSSPYKSYSRGSPEYEAHKKLDSVLHAMYGKESYTDKLGLGNILGHGQSHSGDEGIFEKLGLSSGDYHRGQKSWFSREPEREKGWFGSKEPEHEKSWFGRSRDHDRSRTDEALSYMGDTFRGIKGKFSPQEEESRGIGSYLYEHLPGFGGKQDEYQRPQKSFLDKVKSLYSKSEWEKVDDAEKKLREVLQAAAQRGEL